jgi:hypothetical protein
MCHKSRERAPNILGEAGSSHRSFALALGTHRQLCLRLQKELLLQCDPLPSDPEWTGHRVYLDARSREARVPAADVWAIIEGIGGDNGWYSMPVAWAARGALDKMVGGVGLRRGRAHPHDLRVGDALDWWRVDRIDRGSFLRLRAEMKVPGLAWLELSVVANEKSGGSTYSQRAIFFPRGLAGRLYWVSILPFHGIIFSGMARRIVAAAESRTLTRPLGAS